MKIYKIEFTITCHEGDRRYFQHLEIFANGVSVGQAIDRARLKIPSWKTVYSVDRATVQA